MQFPAGPEEEEEEALWEIMHCFITGELETQMKVLEVKKKKIRVIHNCNQTQKTVSGREKFKKERKITKRCLWSSRKSRICVKRWESWLGPVVHS